MNELIAICGLSCGTCPIYIASRETDIQKKELMINDIIDLCKTYFGVDYKLEDINDCEGCRTDNDKIFFACKNCKIKECASSKVYENCAFCNDYPCEKLEGIFNSSLKAKQRLDELRIHIKNA